MSQLSASFDGDPTIDSFVREAAATSLISYPGRFSGTERYELVKKLGEGGFGVVFEVIDHRRGGRAALKVLRQPYAERLYRFKREFRVLSEQVHPHLVRLYEMTASGRDLFFTMELIDGVPLLSWVARSPERAREAVRQLAAGLAALHAAKLLHRDVKPSNVMVDRGGRVVLLDFGLAVELESGNSSELVGTPLYMSPEQCAEEPLGEASDWYSVGLLLFEALTGRLPFDGTVMQLIHAKQKEDAPPPSRFASGVPEDLERLCVELLRRDPAARPDGGEVLRRLSAPAPARVELAPFVGRTAELAALHAAAAAPGCRVMLARGPSGIGKSALLRRFLDELRERHPETVILQGRCYERESVPYKALDAVLDALARHLKRLPEVEAAALLPREASALERLFPVLRRVFEQRPVARAALDPAELRRRGAQALRELLARLGDRHPVVVCIDDLQWGDADSAALLADLVAGPDAPALLWLAFVREEEATTSPLLGKLAQLRQSLLRDVEVRELRLGPLAGDEVRQLAAVLLEEAHGDGARAEAIAGESGGSPFFLQELARGGGGDVGELVLRRARALPPAARGLLEVIAVAARPIELVHVLATAGGGAAIPAEELRDALARLRAERLIRGRENELVECYHDRIRDPVTRAIEPERLRAIHLTLAAALEGRADAAQIAEHYAEGGDGTRALAWMVRGAEAAAATLAFDEALRLYRRALQLAGEARDVELELAAAEAASAAGHGVEAAQLWLGALDRVGEARRLELQRRAGDDLLLAGRFDEGWAAMGAVLAQLGVSVPRSVGGAIARVLWGRAQRAIFGRRFRASAQPVDARVRARLDAIVSIEQSAWLVDPIRAAAIQAQYLPLALESGDATHAAAAMLMEALASSSEGTRASKKTHALLSEARLLSESAFGGSLEPIVAVIVGTVAMMEGRFADAHRELERAAELDPSSWPGHGSVRMILSMVQLINLFWLGRAGEAMALVPLELSRAEERSNLTGWAWIKVIEGWALGLRGRVAAAIAAEDEVLARVPARGFELPRWYLDYNRIMHALEEGDGERAWSAVTAARKRDRFAISSQSQSVYALRVGAAAALAHAGQKPAARTAMLAEVRQFVASIEGKGAPWAEGIARALQAAAVSVAGDGERARRLLHEAEPLLSAHRQELMLAAVRAALGRGGEWSASEGVSREALWAQLPGAWRLE